jgi:hypothetical protein
MESARGTYEERRARELRPFWERFTVGLDIHSTTAKTAPMIISRGNNFDRIANLVRGFPIDILISNIDAVQIGAPVFAFYGVDANVPVFAIEAGQHTETETLRRAQDCTVSLLQNLSMIASANVTPTIRTYTEYEIVGSILFDSMAFDFIKQFESFDSIRKGDLLATNTKTGEEIRAVTDGHLIIPTKKTGVKKDISEEVSFVSKPEQIRRA